MSNKIAKTAILVTAITLLSKISGFFRDIMLAASYGTSLDSDAFIMAQSIVSLFTTLVLAALGTTIVPVLSDYLSSKSREETSYFLNVVYTICICVTLLVCILVFLFTKNLVGLFAPSFSSEARVLTVQLTQIMLPTFVLTTIITLNNAKLQNHGSFLVPASIGFPLNLFSINSRLILK